VLADVCRVRAMCREYAPMLADIFMLKAEAAARAAKEPSTSQFVPITLPAAPAKPASVPSIRAV
jgi:hypothetical protein